ncbi:hypothetical protein BH11PLA1_BH11PLA1_09000 [soil metagenome]
MATTVDTLNASGASTQSRANVSKFSDMSSEDFVKIMFSELTRQDPLKPNDSNAMLQQLNSIRSIEANLTLERKLDTLVSQNQLSAAGSLIGAYISGLTETNQHVEGQVVSINQTKDGPVLNLAEGWRVPFANVDEITLASLVNHPPGPAPTPNPTPATTPAQDVVPGTTGSTTLPLAGPTTVQQMLAALGGGPVVTPPGTLPTAVDVLPVSGAQ